MAKKKGFFRKLKKKITLRGAIKGVKQLGSQLPVLGGFLSDAAQRAEQARTDAREAVGQGAAEL
ncbi:MAG: hypothetical protein HZC42_06915, partial [Candidatus Eisenbacteria bacterium]|nr:hypothetical protein [Candidatus Eisenbacteria bacterium]